MENPILFIAAETLKQKDPFLKACFATPTRVTGFDLWVVYTLGRVF
jgi:hypothetical protein